MRTSILKKVQSKVQTKVQTISGCCCCITILTCCCVIIAGCSGSEKKTADKATTEQSIARVGDSQISVIQFKAYMAEKLSKSRRYLDEQEVKKRLDEMVVEEVLYQEGIRKGVQDDPQIQKRIRQIIVQKLMEQEVSSKVWSREVNEKELRAYYKEKEQEFNRPEMVRLADIFIAVPMGTSPDEKVRLQKKAEKILAEAVAAQKNRGGFGELIQNYSDIPLEYPLGDTGFFDRQGKPVGIDNNLAEAGFTLPRNGTIHQGLIETADGFHVIMRIGKRSAVHVPFEKVRHQLEKQLRRQEVAKSRGEYIARLQNKADIRTEDQMFKDIGQEIILEYGGLAQKEKIVRPPSPGSAGNPGRAGN